MRRQLEIRTRTLLLIALAVIVAAQGLSLWLRLHQVDGDPDNSNDLNFLLEVYGEPGGVEYPEGYRPELPRFNPSRGFWTFDGQPLSEFASYVEGLEVGPHGSSPFVIIDLPDDATVGDYEKALASLTLHGICRVGVYAPLSNRKFVSLRPDSVPSDSIFVPVYRVINVKFDTGATHACVDRFPPWAPWAMHRE
jgi:hypothetical protein